MTELIVRLADLAEAEGRTLRDVVRHEARDARAYVEKLGVGAVLVAAAALFVIAGAGLVLAALFLWLREPIGAAGAAAVSGVVAVAMGAVLLWIFRKTVGT